MVRVVSLSPDYPLSRTDRSLYGWLLVPPKDSRLSLGESPNRRQPLTPTERQRRWRLRKKKNLVAVR